MASFAEEVLADNPTAWWRFAEAEDSPTTFAIDQMSANTVAYHAHTEFQVETPLNSICDFGVKSDIDGDSPTGHKFIEASWGALDTTNIDFSFEWLGRITGSGYNDYKTIVHTAKNSDIVVDPTDQIVILESGPVVRLDSNYTIVRGDLYHIVWTLDAASDTSATERLYVNGALVASRTGTVPATSGIKWEFGSSNTTLNLFQGEMHEAAIYIGQVLSPTRIRAHYDGIEIGELNESCELESGDAISDTDLVIPGPYGAPEAQEHAVQASWVFEWAEEDPGGFMEGRLSFPWGISDASPINYLDDVYYNPHALESDLDSEEVYRGRVERIDRRSDAQGQWIDYTLFGWIRNAQGDRLYWGRLRDRRVDAWYSVASQVGGPWLDQFQNSGVVPDVEGNPKIIFSLPGGTNLGGLAGGRIVLDWRTDPYSPNPEIKHIKFNWEVDRVVAGAGFYVFAYHPVGSGAPPTLIYYAPHTLNDKTVDLYPTGTGGLGAGQTAVIPPGTWRLLFYPIHLGLPVNSVPDPGVSVHMAHLDIGQFPIPPALTDMSPTQIAQRILIDSCPALDSDGFTATTPNLSSYLVETPSTQTSIWDDLLLWAPAGFTYWVREKKANNRYRTYFGPQPTTVRYQVTGVELTGLGGDVVNVCNKVVITYTNYLDQPATYVKTQSITFLNDVSEDLGEPFLRERHLNVGKLKGNTYQENVENADKIAATLLAESQEPEETGQFRVIGKQVYDLSLSRFIDFRYIKPGELIRVVDTGTGTAAEWRIRRVEKALDTRMECQVIVGKGTTRLDAVILQAQESQDLTF